jgi:hypothetical protein
VRVPTCPRVSLDAVVYVPEGALRKRVEAEAVGLHTVRRAPAGFRWFPLVNTVAAESFTAVDVATHPTSFVLAVESEQPDEQITQLARRLASDDVTVTRANEVVEWEYFLGAEGEPGRCAGERVHWPYDQDALLVALNFNERLGRRQPYQQTIAIVDSGITEELFGVSRSGTQSGYQIPPASWPLQFSYDSRELGGESDDGNENGWLGDIIGIDATRSPSQHQFDSVVADHGTSRYAHGTAVAKVALGGALDNPALPARLRSMLDLKIVKVAKLNETGNTTIPPEAMTEAFRYILGLSERSELAGVVNVSAAIQGDPGNRLFDLVTRANRQYVVIVAAAGNYEIATDRQLYPADYGGRVAENVITVAGTDKTGGKYASSNSSPDRVDIAAPGCDIPTIMRNAVNETYFGTGTSFAAPLVTFSVAMLQAEGLAVPHLIKRRVIVSADVRSSLRGTSLSEGELNVAKAISFWTDVVEEDGERYLQYGFLEGIRSTLSDGQERSIENICGKPWSEVLKFTRLDAPQDGATHRVLFAGSIRDGVARIIGPRPCSPDPDWSLLFRREDNNVLRIRLGDVTDFIQATLPDNVDQNEVRTKLELPPRRDALTGVIR